VGIVTRIGRLALVACAIVAWLLLLGFAVAAARGGLRSALSYTTTRAPLDDGVTAHAGETILALWSGWYFDPAGLRKARALDPDIAFMRSADADRCRVTLAAKPAEAGSRQRVDLSLNGARPTLLMIDGDGTYNVALDGRVAKGANVLSFHLEDAMPSDVFIRSIDVRSVRIDCGSGRRR
jgi:hypothetical protein